jgi:hypothetical protein
VQSADLADVPGVDEHIQFVLNISDQRRVWDSNPRGRVNALAVFKTAAIGL